MKAITVRQPYAAAIISGEKTREFRSWNTNHRGPLLIHAAASRAALGGLDADEFFFSSILGVVDVVGVEPTADGGFAWVLANPRPIDPVHATGRLGLFTVDVAALAAEYPDIAWLLDL